MGDPKIYVAERRTNPSRCQCPASVYYPWATRPTHPDCRTHGENGEQE